MTQSPRHKSIPIGDLEWLLMPAILLKQFRIFYEAGRVGRICELLMSWRRLAGKRRCEVN